MSENVMLEHVARFTLPAAYSLLPTRMASREATAFVLAIGLQESRFEHRLQEGGPARGFWQFERGGGIQGVLEHPRTRAHIQAATAALRYPVSADACHFAVAHNDVLAAIFARLLLWTLPAPLPTELDELELAWGQYLAAWRPGKPHIRTWGRHVRTGWELA